MEPSTMSKPTDRAAPHHTLEQVDELIGQAKSATGILPTFDHCQQLADQLRPAIGHLADQVRIRQGYLLERGATWQQYEDALLKAQAALCGGFGIGLRSAALHVATLGEALAALAGCIRETR